MAGGTGYTYFNFDEIDLDSEYSLFYSTSYDGTYAETLPSNLPNDRSTYFLKIKTKSGRNVSNFFYPTANVSSFAADAAIMFHKVTDTSNQGDLFYWSIHAGDVDSTLTFHKSEAPSIGNIPMGELTFNGVQSVTYNGTDYTKLVVDGTNYPPLPVIISFTIDGTSYQAEEDMTWGEWVESSYNTGGFEIISGRVINSSGYIAYEDQSVNIAVSKNTIIIANRSYVYGSGTPDKEP